MKNFKPTPTLVHYKIPLSLNDFDALSTYDYAWVWDDDLQGAPHIDRRLTELGCDDIEYSGHFGPNFYFSLESHDDTPETWKEIEETFDVYIGIARKWQKDNKVSK